MDLEPGFFQGRQHGLASGRVSPRDAIRPSRHDSILAEHGIVHSGTIDPNQGQLFNARAMPSRSPQEIVESHGVPPELAGGGHRGFMPGLQRSTPERTRAAKVTAVKALDTSRNRTGASRGGAPVKETLEDREAVYGMGKPAPWYSHTEGGSVRPGEASNLIADAAARQGVSHARMTRAVAVTSPRTGWDDQNEGHGAGGHSGGTPRPNLQSAEGVVSAVRHMPPDSDVDKVKEIGAATHGKSLGGMKAKAAVEFVKGEPTKPIPVYEAASQKVPNFEQSLHLDHVSPYVKEQASKSYTVDVHDTTSMGADETLLKGDTGYHVAAMTGRRAALRQHELPPNFQASMWNVIRDAAGPASMGTHRLLSAVPRGPKLGDLRVNPEAMPPEHAFAQHAEDARNDDRSPTAKRLGTDF